MISKYGEDKKANCPRQEARSLQQTSDRSGAPDHGWRRVGGEGQLGF